MDTREGRKGGRVAGEVHTDAGRAAFVWVAERREGGREEGEAATEDAAERKQRDGAEKDRTPSLVNNAN